MTLGDVTQSLLLLIKIFNSNYALIVVYNPAIDNLVQSSLESKNEDLRLEWIPYEEIIDIKPTQIDNVYYAIRKQR